MRLSKTLSEKKVQSLTVGVISDFIDVIESEIKLTRKMSNPQKMGEQVGRMLGTIKSEDFIKGLRHGIR
jgi:hypothetical protein